jgi:cysteinyl-tRNA synthetase
MEPRIRIWNTLSGKKEGLPARAGAPLRLFVCGPTVYDLTHIGHARTYVFFDFFAKYLRTQSMNVRYVQNITDIDDKIIRRAKEKGKKPLALSKELTKSYLADMKRLGVTAVDTYAAATEFIPEIVGQVTHLIKKGFAYKIESDGYYFDIRKFHGYGKLSRRTAEQAEDSISRIDDSIGKKNKGDFCLWKFPSADIRGHDLELRGRKQVLINGEPLWCTALGWGRPGWHIEDTAISEHFFGPQYDIHGGGLDLKFPHHEAEIAQQEAASGKVPFVKLWMHTGMLTVGGEKMSKSVGNFITLKAFLKTHSPAAFRMFALSSHYRAPLDYTEERIRAAEQQLEGVREFLGRLNFAHASKARGTNKFPIATYERELEQALADDVNTPQALAAVFSAMRDANPRLWSIAPTPAAALRRFVERSFDLLGITFKMPRIPAHVKACADAREKARRNQQFVQSDALRKKIQALGYVVEDTPRGPFLWPKHPR